MVRFIEISSQCKYDTKLVHGNKVNILEEDVGAKTHRHYE